MEREPVRAERSAVGRAEDGGRGGQHHAAAGPAQPTCPASQREPQRPGPDEDRLLKRAARFLHVDDGERLRLWGFDREAESLFKRQLRYYNLQGIWWPEH
jgi:hypothetical protein